MPDRDIHSVFLPAERRQHRHAGRLPLAGERPVVVDVDAVAAAVDRQRVGNDGAVQP